MIPDDVFPPGVLEEGEVIAWGEEPSVSSMRPSSTFRISKIIDLSQIDFELGKDGRMYLAVELYGKMYYGLLDSGATVTVMGRKGWEKLERLGVQLAPSWYEAVKVANGQRCPVLGQVDISITVEGRTRLCTIQVVPDLDSELILGMDFWKLMGIVPSIMKESCSCIPGQTLKVVDIADIVVGRETLNEECQAVLENLISKYKPTLGRPQLGCTHLVSHEIDTGDAAPIRSRYYSYSPAILNVMHKELDEMLAQKIVEPSKSPWASPVLIVRKKDGRYRWIVDLRKVNRVTRADAYPLPRVNYILDQLRGAKFISSIDLTSAYFQIPLTEQSKEKTAFIVPGRGLFQFTRMPQGLHTSPATWQRLIDQVIGEDLKPYVFVYLDDIIVIAPTFDKHMELLRAVFSRLESAGLTINMDKCQFCRSELRYLGYVVNENGLQVDPDKVQAISDFKRPENQSELKRFLGLASWYRRFVEGFASIAAPLHTLTSKKIRFRWTEECERAFMTLKEKLMTAPVLICPDFSKPFDLFTDACSWGLGAVLSQEGRVVAYASRALTSGERKYSTTELECLAVLWAIEKFRCYLEGFKFKVITDHSSLRWLDNLKEPCGRLGRWAVRLQQYDYEIVHRKGTEHQAPDALSRSPLPLVDAIPNVSLITVESTVQDEWYTELKESILSRPDEFPSWRVEGEQIFKLVSNSEGGAQWNRLVPREMREKVLKECHDAPTAGHFGVSKTLDRVKQLYYWPKMRRDISSYVSRCHICLKIKVPPFKPAGFMGQSKKVTAPFQVISSDIIGPFPKSLSGYTSLVVSVCLFSKYVWVRPLRRATAEAVRNHLVEDIFLKYGVPSTLVCDNGSQYKGKVMQKLCKDYGIQMFKNLVYHAQSNPTERVNKVVKTVIKAYVKENQRTWDTNLHCTTNAINTTRHDVTGYTPHEIVFSSKWCANGLMRPSLNESAPVEVENPVIRETKFQQQLRETIQKRLQSAYEKNCKQYNLRRRDVSFDVGQTVYRRNFTKSSAGNYYSAGLAAKYVGPYTIIKKCGYKAYKLRDKNGKEEGPFYVGDLKPAPKDLHGVNDDQPRVSAVVGNPSGTPVSLCSWNVAGLRALIRKGGDKFLENNFDIICLQETKCKPGVAAKLFDELGMHSYLFCSTNSGYAGVSIASKDPPLDVLFGFDENIPDSEARVITAFYAGFVLVNIYAPYSGDFLGKLPKRIEWDRQLVQHLVKLSNRKMPILISGDFNVAHLNGDVSSRELQPYTPGATVTERLGFQTLLNLGFVDSFRLLHPEAREAYSFWRYGGDYRANNHGWRFDYFLVSGEFSSNILAAGIESKVTGSDHCPVTLQVSMK